MSEWSEWSKRYARTHRTIRERLGRPSDEMIEGCQRCGRPCPNDFCRTCKHLASEWRRRLRIVDFTLEDFVILRDRQNERCAVCKDVCATGRQLCVDHDHKTGAVRGLLCYRCNRFLISTIERFHFTPAALREAARYLQLDDDDD